MDKAYCLWVRSWLIRMLNALALFISLAASMASIRYTLISLRFNMIVLGGLLKLRPIVTLENVIKGLKKTLPERHHHLIPMNEEAIKKGMELRLNCAWTVVSPTTESNIYNSKIRLIIGGKDTY